MQPKSAVGIVLALLARQPPLTRPALLSTFTASLRAEVERVLEHVESAPPGSSERMERIRDLTRDRTPQLTAWPTDLRVAALLGAHVDPLTTKPLTFPLPRRRYRIPQGVREFLLQRAHTEAQTPLGGAWHA